MKAKTKRNLLITLADKNYVEQAKQLFSSVYWNAGWKGEYMLLSHEIPERELKWFRKKGILVKKCRPLYSKNFSRLPFTHLDKFYLFTPEFKKWKNIVYLDADIIVRASLDKLTKVKGFTVVQGTCSSKLFNQFMISKRNKNLYSELEKNYNLKKPAFNSGVMAFNTGIIEKNSFLKLKELLEKYNKIMRCIDQTILNLFFYKKWKKLPSVYNIRPYYLINFENIKPEEVKGIILHFIEFKPCNTTNYFYKEWKNNLEKAELINFKKIQNAKIWTKKEIEEYSLVLEKIYKLYSYKYTLFKVKRFIGLYLKKNFPRLYFKLKKLKRD